MIKLKTNLKQFENTIKIIAKISEETDYIFNQEGIKVRAIDASGTHMGVFKFNKNMFDEYELEKEKVITLGNTIFGKLIKKVGKKELNIDFTETEIVLSNPKEKFTLKYFVEQNDNRPDLVPNCTSVWKIKSNEFSTILNEMVSLGVICCLDGSDKLIIKMKSNMVKGETLTSAEKIQSEDCYCYYDLGMISSILEIKNVFEEIRVGFGFDTPLMVKGDNENLNFVFIVAPRVE